MSNKNKDLFAEFITITAKWLWWCIKLLLAIVYLLTKLGELILKGFNYLLLHLVKFKNHE